ncbi:hypothetical protein [Methylocystis sp. B8]|uniref:hypothetical protein n=1 Tax=Methylocystis sp. B8 TaxID=544938 RepID=UPI0010FD34CE|nr:hypothetical protein [Methylocystis sp. B8]TLG79067.1 hypothetical protein FEV16_03325 [Methylocystis sp. B8]
MFANKTAIERAFDLARSGECSRISDLTRRLDREGYNSAQIYGPLLKKQLAGLIGAAKNAHAEDAADFSLDCSDGELRRHRRVALGKRDRLSPQTEDLSPL